MPPSPFRRGPRGDSHKRRCSLENELSFREKDDVLALFNELQSRERDNFLLESADEFEDLLSSKMKPFPELRLGIDISARGESSDLLNADTDKNDYEWLLTPPETPLFSSLDDEPASINLVHDGRARNRPISISRSSTMERSHRRSRGSPSPQRSSPSPRSGSGSFPGRPSSAPHSNPVPLHSSSPSRRPSPPPVKPSTPPRSLTPTSRSTTTSSSRVTSPARTSRGNSASPKVRAWQSNIPGFSLEAPPNLRTSLADRPTSYVRGSSPASRTIRDSSIKIGRKSMSPTPSRHSQERDRLNSHSKVGSIASSGDEDVDSLQSGPASVFERPVSRKGVSGYPSGRPLGFSKKPINTFSTSSAPKRSFDSSMRQTDRMTPPNMFRPLLSSVPSSTFYSGKTSSSHCTLVTRNSSVTTSSNASCDLETTAAHDTEGNDQYHDDMASDCARETSSDIGNETYKMDARREDTGHEGHDELSEARLGEIGKGYAVGSNPADSEESRHCDRSMATVCLGNTLICSICGGHYRTDELAENDGICLECKRKELLRSSTFKRLETTHSSIPLTDDVEESHVIQRIMNVPQFGVAMGDAQSRDISEVSLNQEGILEGSQRDSQSNKSFPEDSLSVSIELESADDVSKQQVMSGRTTIDNPCHTDMNICVAEGAGISVLLNRSSSVKGPIIHGRTITSSAISFDDLSYSRDLTSSMRSSIGHGNGSFSASSSIDLTSTRRGEMFMRRQLSCKLSDSSSKPQSTVSLFSGISVPVNQSFGHSTSSHEGSFEVSNEVVVLENAESLNAGPSFGRAPITEASVGISECHTRQDIDEDRQNRVGEIQNVRESNLTEFFLAEEGTTLKNRVGQVDVTEDLPQFSLSTMSEIEINDSHPSSPGSQIDVVIREDLEDSFAVMHRDADAKDASLEYVRSDHADRIVEESTVTMKHDDGGRRTKCLTLGEATDTILFCSSIIHDLAYKASSIAIEKEKDYLELLEGSRPMVTIPDKPCSIQKDPQGVSTGRTPKTQKPRKRRTSETEAKPSLARNDIKPNHPVVRNVGLPKNIDGMKPPKLESKCNCTIM